MEEPTQIGGEYTESEAIADARAYERSLIREQRELYQQKVDNAPEHARYVPALEDTNLERLGGITDYNSAKKEFRGYVSHFRRKASY